VKTNNAVHNLGAIVCMSFMPAFALVDWWLYEYVHIVAYVACSSGRI